MQAGSSSLLHSLRHHVLRGRNFWQGFHADICARKAASSSRKRSRKTGIDAQTPRPSARKRLVTTLKPIKHSETYEVAAQPSNSRNKTRKPQQEKNILTDTPASQSRDTHKGRLPHARPVFSRDDAPHVGRTSWHGPRSPLSSGRRGRLGGENSDTCRLSISERHGRNSQSHLKDGLRLKEVPPRTPPGDTYPAQNLVERIFYEKQRLQEKKQHLTHGQSHRPRSVQNQLREEFDTTASTGPLQTLPDYFSSPPLMDGLLQSLHDVLGPDAKPSPIQSLSLKHLLTPPPPLPEDGQSKISSFARSWGQYLLASETGSGKSIAYLLPMIQYLKLTENLVTRLPPFVPHASCRPFAVGPRGLILAPTHELSRQLSSFAKALLHNVRLRVLCASRANNFSSARGRNSTASQLKRELDDINFGTTDNTHGTKTSRPVDVLVGTPTKILEMVRGWGWNRERNFEEEWDDARKNRAKKWIAGPPEAGLANVEWVVVDEADVLFDKDFQESTRMLLADIAQARGYDHPTFSTLNVTPPTPSTLPTAASEPLAYPFHLLLASATIPSSLASYLTTNHPNLIRLVSPNLHHLPSTLKTEHYGYTSGNKNSDIEKRIRRVWADDASTCSNTRSKILIFCNKSSKVEDLGLYLTEKGIANVALTSTSRARLRGSNRHLTGFMKTTDDSSSAKKTLATPADLLRSPAAPAIISSDPCIMITTSLLSRGLDFSPQIKHVFIVDEPRNMIDFLHRAGRSGRAGHEGKVVVFGKMKGRGSGTFTEVRRKVSALAR